MSMLEVLGKKFVWRTYWSYLFEVVVGCLHLHFPSSLPAFLPRGLGIVVTAGALLISGRGFGEFFNCLLVPSPGAESGLWKYCARDDCRPLVAIGRGSFDLNSGFCSLTFLMIPSPLGLSNSFETVPTLFLLIFRACFKARTRDILGDVLFIELESVFKELPLSEPEELPCRTCAIFLTPPNNSLHSFTAFVSGFSFLPLWSVLSPLLNICFAWSLFRIGICE